MRLSRADEQAYLELIDNYKHANGSATYAAREIIVWGMARNLLSNVVDVVAWHTERISEVLRRQKVNGDGTREYYAVRSSVPDPEAEEEPTDGEEREAVQRYLWSSIDDAPDDFIEESIKQRLENVRKDYQSIASDVRGVIKRRPHMRKRLTQLLIQFQKDIRGDG